jgi:hypothetical protein
MNKSTNSSRLLETTPWSLLLFRKLRNEFTRQLLFN